MFCKSILVTEEENKLRKQLQLLDDPKPKWKKSSYGQHDSLTGRNCQMENRQWYKSSCYKVFCSRIHSSRIY